MWSRRHGTSEQAWSLAQFNIGDHEQKLIKYTHTDCYNGWYSGRKQTGAALNYLEKEAAWTLRSRRNLAHLSNHYWWNDGNLCHVSHSSVVRCMVDVCGCLWHSCLAIMPVSCVCACKLIEESATCSPWYAIMWWNLLPISWVWQWKRRCPSP